MTNDRRGADQVWASAGSQTAGENGRALRALALAAVVIGLIGLTTAACVLSYSSVHDFALRAGISRSLARIYPDIGDAMLVMAGCSVLALRGAGLFSKVYGWLCFILLLGALAASGVVHEAGLSMPIRAAEITAAVFPWALVLVAFGLLLVLLRYAKRRRQSHRVSSEGVQALASSRAAIEPPALEAAVAEPPVVEPTALEDGSYEGGEEYDIGAYERADDYDAGGPYEYGTIQATSQYPTVPPEAEAESEPEAEHHEPEPQHHEPGAKHHEPEPKHHTPAEGQEEPSHPPRAVIRPAEMQLRARTPRQPEPAADDPSAEPSARNSPPVRTPTATEPPTSGFTGDTIPRGELNPAPTSDESGAKPPDLDRPRSSPTPPS